MPTYEYQCEKCGYIFEEFQSIKAKPLEKCKKEACDGKVHRLFSAGAGFLFKGSGFYVTDYRSDSYRKGASSDSSSTSSTSSSTTNASTTNVSPGNAPSSTPK